MNNLFGFGIPARKKFAYWASELSIDQLNFIPENFKNNIAWHLGHIAVSTEILCYYKTGIDPDRIIIGLEQYRNGTMPMETIPMEEISCMQKRLFTSLEEINDDFASGKFEKVIPFEMQNIGFEFDNIKTVFECCTHHDMLHLGQAEAIAKWAKKI